MSGIIGGAGSKSGVIGTTELDYEEGTWTPSAVSLASGSPTLTGTYTKIGNFVYGTIYISGTTTATADTTRFSGLPFTVGTGGFSSWVNTGASTGGVSQASGTNLITPGWGSAGNIKGTFMYTV
jgi:hypothetical protein